MPLLLGKVYILNKRVKKGPGEVGDRVEAAAAVVTSTGEVCASEEEATRKRVLYAERIWSCRITGQSGLTLKEALKSEQGAAKVLKTAVMRCHEPVLLAQAHHSRDSLENIIHKAWTLLHEEFCIGEPVFIKLTSPKPLSLRGVVVKIDRSGQENGDLESSPNKVPSDASISDKENIKKKTVPVKKSYHYGVKLSDMDKLVNDIPADTIERTLRPPSKDQIRMFIRSHAIRHSNKNIYPWIVDDDIVKKFKLPILEPQFVNDKVKLKEMSLKAEIQMYNKLLEDSQKKNGSTTVDLTVSDDENDKKVIKSKKVVGEMIGSKKLKQMTLLDLHSTNSSTPKPHAKIKSPFTSPSRQVPPIAQQLIRLMKENSTDPMINQLILKCCKYSDLQISRLPELIKGPITEKKEKLELKKKLRNMTPAEKEVFFAERRLQLRQQLRDKKMNEMKKDDADIEHKVPLIEGSPVEMIGGITHEQWSRIVSLSEFVRSFKGLLGPASTNETGDLNVYDFCRAIIGVNDNDRERLADIVCLFLKPLLQDGDLRIRKEMGVSLGEIPVTACTAGELLRLILPMSATVCEGEDEKEVEINDDVECINQNINTNLCINVTKTNEIHTHYNAIILPICDKLTRIEMCDLSLEEKIIILEMLQNHILELDIISSFIDECHRDTTEAYKSRLTDVKEWNDKLRVVRQSMTEMYKLKPTHAADESAIEEKINVEDESISSSTKRRLSLDIKNKEAEEKEKMLDFERQYQRLEKEEANYKKLIEQSHNTYNTAYNEAKQLMRVIPIGSDRNNCRYWRFRTASESVIYVEKEVGDISQGETVYSTWTMFNGTEAVNMLINSLDENGYREDALKKELSRIVSNMQESSKTMNEVESYKDLTNVEEDSESFLVRGFKDELRETELNIRQGSLGGVEDYDIWEKRLSEASSMSELKESFASVFLGVHERFWNVPLKSAAGRNEYLTEIEIAITQSRLNLLQYFLDVCICWSKSASDDKCRVCHKNNQENRMLLCDACNRAYHIFCLRPPIKVIPEGEWLCPGCKPVDRAVDTDICVDKVRPMKTKKVRSSAKEEDAEVLSEDEGVCCVCQTSEDGLGKCVSCGNNYHAQCHEPPLRSMRRNNWCCSNCRVEDSIKVKAGKNKQHLEDIVSESNDDEEEADKKIKKNKKNQVNKKKSKEEEQSEHSDEEKVTKKKNKKNITKRSLKNEESDEEEEVVIKTTRSGRTNGSKRKYESDHEGSGNESGEQDRAPSGKKKSRRNVTKKVMKVEESDEEEEVVKKTRNRTVNGRLNGSKIKYESDNEERVEESDQDIVMKMEESSFTSGNRSSNRKRKSVLENHSVIKRSKTVRDTKEEHISKSIKSILKQLMSNKSSWPFREPVDEKEVPDYYTIIDNPMDLSTMTARHKLGVYDGEDGVETFVKDIAQIFTNADSYNDAESAVLKLSVELEQLFKGIFSKCDLGVDYVR